MDRKFPGSDTRNCGSMGTTFEESLVRDGNLVTPSPARVRKPQTPAGGDLNVQSCQGEADCRHAHCWWHTLAGLAVTGQGSVRVRGILPASTWSWEKWRTASGCD